MDRESLDTTRLVWFGLIALASVGVIAAAIGRRNDLYTEEEVATPPPTPEAATLQCLDGKVYRSIDKLTGQPDAEGFPVREHWTLTFKDGNYVLDQGGVHEAGRYRCDGYKLSASGAVASHRGQIEANGPHLEWDGQGFVTQDSASAGTSPAPLTTSTAH